MSRSYKKYYGNCYRNPHGHKQALIAGLPKRAIPPSSWDDISLDKHVMIPFRVAAGLKRRGESYEYIVKHLMKKFKVRRDDAEWIAAMGWWNVEYERRHIPEGLLIIGKEKELKN
jgi:hypothetical protein